MMVIPRPKRAMRDSIFTDGLIVFTLDSVRCVFSISCHGVFGMRALGTRHRSWYWWSRHGRGGILRGAWTSCCLSREFIVWNATLIPYFITCGNAPLTNFTHHHTAYRTFFDTTTIYICCHACSHGVNTWPQDFVVYRCFFASISCS